MTIPAIAYGLVAEGNRDFDTATFGQPLCRDLLGARQVARELGLPHHRIPYSDWSIEGESEFMSRIGGGAAGLQVAHNEVGYRHVAGRSRLACTGFLGDAATGAHVSYSEVQQMTLILVGRWTAESAQSYREEVEALRADLDRRFGELSGLSKVQKMLVLDFTIRQAGWIAYAFALCGWWVDLATPFVNRDLLQFVFQLPEDRLRRQRLYDAWLAKKAVELRRKRAGTGSLVAAVEAALPKRLSAHPRWLAKRTTVPWQAMEKRAEPWIRRLATNDSEDPRLSRFLLAELDDPRPRTWFSPALTAAALVLARRRSG